MNINDKKLNKITTTLCKPNDTINIKLTIKIITGVKKNNDIYSKNALFIYDNKDTLLNSSFVGAYLGLTGEVQITSLVNFSSAYGNNKTPDAIGKPRQMPISIIFTQNNLPNLINAIESAYLWLTDSSFDGLYTTDTQGRLIGISNKKLCAKAIGAFNKILILQPAVIFDEDQVSYQGIQIGCTSGIIGSLTATEFEVFRNTFIELSKNYNTTIHTIYNAALMTLVTNK